MVTGSSQHIALGDNFTFLFLCVNVFNYMLTGLKISLNLRVSFGRLKDSLVSLSATMMDIINPTLSNPVM